MEFLELGQGTPVFNDPLGAGATKRVPENAAKIMAEYYSHALSRPSDELEQEIVNGMDSLLRNEVNGVVQQKADSQVESRILTAVNNQEDPNVVLDEIRNTRFGYMVPQITMDLEGKGMDPASVRLVDRVLRVDELITHITEQTGEGVGATVGQFVDIAVSDGLQSIIGGLGGLVGLGEDTFENASNRVELAKELNDLLLSDGDYATFEAQAMAILTRISDAGFFTHNNGFYLEEFLEMVDEAGQGPISGGAKAFQVLDIATAGIGGLVVKGAGRLGALPSKVTQLKGPRAGIEVVTKEIDKAKPSAIIAQTEPSISKVANHNESYLTSPDLPALREAEATNAALDYIKRNEGVAFTDPRILEARLPALKKDFAERIKGHSRHERNIDVDVDPFGNIIGKAILGRSDGELYATREKAQSLADKIGGEVRETLEGAEKRFFVLKEENLSSQGLARATNLNEIADGWTTALTSTARATTRYLDGALKWGEMNNAKVMKELGKQYRAVVGQSSRKDRRNVNGIFEELRDDPRFSDMRQMPSKSWFISRYTAKYDEPPTDTALELFDAMGQLNDADYFLNADRVFKEAVDNKETMVKLGDEFFRSRPVTRESIGDNPNVWDMKLKKFRPATPNDKIYEVKDFAYSPPGQGAVKYVVGDNLPTRRLFHSDVMSYNVGGHRVYTSQVQYYLKQTGTALLGSGDEVPVKPNTFMATRTPEEAREVEQGWNTIADALAKNDPKVDMDEVVRNNSKWHDSIETKADFEKLAKEHGLNPKKRIATAKDGEAASDVGDMGSMWAGEKTIGDRFRSIYNDRTRGNRPILGYGGEALSRMSPQQAIERGFAGAVNQSADRAYLNQASKGLVRAIQKLEDRGIKVVDNWSEMKGMSLAQQIDKMSVRTGTPEGIKVAKELDTIRRVANRKTHQETAMKTVLDNAASFVYGRRNLTENMIGKKGAERVQAGADYLAELDYLGYTRAAAFHSKLGMLSVDQLFVQATQGINAVAISGATLGHHNALRVATGSIPLQRALASSNPDTIARIAANQAPLTGVSADDFIMVRNWLEKQGRGVVDRTAMEENLDAVIGGPRRAQLSNISSAFFNMGEVNARMTAAMLNIAEMRAKGFKGDIFSDQVTRRMVARQDILTASMTSKSAASWQQGILSVPLQFMTYNMRIMEQLFTKDVLTVKERWSLGLSHLFLYGAAAVPAAGYLADKYGYNHPEESTGAGFNLVRYGAMDAMLSQLSALAGGSDTALSTRLGVGDGLFQFVEETGTQGLMELAVGPGGTIIYDSLTSFANVLTGIASGQSLDLTTYDLNRFARIASSYDDGFKLYLAYTYGDYYTRNSGTVTMNNLSVTDGLLQAMGIPLAQSDQLWATLSFERDRKKNQETTMRLVQEMAREATRQLEADDHEAFKRVWDDTIFLINGLPTVAERKEAMRRLTKTSDLPDTLIRQLIKNGQIDLADRIRTLSQ